MIVALGRRLIFNELGVEGWILIGALVAIVLALRFWPRISDRIEKRWRDR